MKQQYPRRRTAHSQPLTVAYTAEKGQRMQAQHKAGVAVVALLLLGACQGGPPTGESTATPSSASRPAANDSASDPQGADGTTAARTETGSGGDSAGPHSDPAPAAQDVMRIEARIQGLESSLPADLPAGPNSDPALLETLSGLEQDMLDAWKNRSPEKYVQLTAAVGVGVDAEGTRRTRDGFVEVLKKSTLQSVKLFNFRLLKLGVESAVLTYHARLGMKDQPPMLLACSTVWQKTDKGWKARFHQDTPVVEALPQWGPAPGTLGQGILPVGAGPAQGETPAEGRPAGLAASAPEITAHGGPQAGPDHAQPTPAQAASAAQGSEKPSPPPPIETHGGPETGPAHPRPEPSAQEPAKPGPGASGPTASSTAGGASKPRLVRVAPPPPAH